MDHREKVLSGFLEHSEVFKYKFDDIVVKISKEIKECKLKLNDDTIVIPLYKNYKGVINSDRCDVGVFVDRTDGEFKYESTKEFFASRSVVDMNEGLDFDSSLYIKIFNRGITLLSTLKLTFDNQEKELLTPGSDNFVYDDRLVNMKGLSHSLMKGLTAKDSSEREFTHIKVNLGGFSSTCKLWYIENTRLNETKDYQILQFTPDNGKTWLDVVYFDKGGVRQYDYYLTYIKAFQPIFSNLLIISSTNENIVKTALDIFKMYSGYEAQVSSQFTNPGKQVGRGREVGTIIMFKSAYYAAIFAVMFNNRKISTRSNESKYINVDAFGVRKITPRDQNASNPTKKYTESSYNPFINHFPYYDMFEAKKKFIVENNTDIKLYTEFGIIPEVALLPLKFLSKHIRIQKFSFDANSNALTLITNELKEIYNGKQNSNYEITQNTLKKLFPEFDELVVKAYLISEIKARFDIPIAKFKENQSLGTIKGINSLKFKDIEIKQNNNVRRTRKVIIANNANFMTYSNDINNIIYSNRSAIQVGLNVYIREIMNSLRRKIGQHQFNTIGIDVNLLHAPYNKLLEMISLIPTNVNSRVSKNLRNVYVDPFSNEMINKITKYEFMNHVYYLYNRWKIVLIMRDTESPVNPSYKKFLDFINK